MDQILSDQEPWRGDAQRLLMFLYAKKGQRSRAIKQYETFRQILAEELDVTPSSETEELIKAIQAGEIRPAAQKAPIAVQLPDFLKQAALSPGKRRLGFVGRQPELAQLDQYLTTAMAGNGQVAFISGEAGMGKSSLLAEFSRRAQKDHPDLVIASGSCNAFSGTGDPHHPFGKS